MKQLEFSNYCYLLVDLGCLLVPFLVSFHPLLKFYRNWKALLIGVAVMSLIFIPWDIFFTAQGIWGFNDHYILGWRIAGLPIEEYLFFVCIPYACMFTYHCMKYFFSKEPASKFFRYLSIVVALLFLFLAFKFADRWYTFAAHLLCALFLCYHLFVARSSYLGWFMLTFLIIFVPFLVSNGVLTGVEFWKYPFLNFEPEKITQSVVWYNNGHNLRFRLFSMPSDDIAYGMFMLLLTTTIYERSLRSKKLL
jgi:lycopene cyclase domain-containing protein